MDASGQRNSASARSALLMASPANERPMISGLLLQFTVIASDPITPNGTPYVPVRRFRARDYRGVTDWKMI